MRPEIGQLRQAIEQKTRELAGDRERLARIERECHHVWDNPNGVYAPIHHPGYRYEGDPPGTMGVDWRPGGYVEARTEEKWKRTCTSCGKVEETSKPVEKVVRVGGDFGGNRSRY